MPKKKLQEDPELYRGGFLTYMDYFATGEGRTIEINFCYADTKEEAKTKHLDRFYGTDEGARNYFGVGVDVMPINSKQAKDIIKNIFKFGKGLHHDLMHAGTEFHFKFHFNYS